MSLILDALNRADRENRKPDSSPNLETEHAQPQETRTKSAHLPWYILGGVILLVACVGFALFLNHSSSTTENNKQANTTTHSANISNSDATRQTNPAPNIPAQNNEMQNQSLNLGQAGNVPPISAPQPAQQLPNKAERVRQEFIQAQYKQQEQKAKEEQQKLTAVNSSNAATKAPAPQQKQITGLYQQPSVTSAQEKAAAEEVPSKVEAQYQQAKTDTQTQKNRTTVTPNQMSTTSDNQLDFYGHIGSIRDLPFHAQEKIPSMMYTEHNNARKSVTINGKEYKEKSTIAPELVIEKVLVDGIILKYQQYTFKMRSYNNWINL